MPAPNLALLRAQLPSPARLGRLAVIAVPAVYLLAVLTTTAGLADENRRLTSHAPVGAVTAMSAEADGSLHVAGWARDPDARRGSQVVVYGLVDGSIAARARAAVRHAGTRPLYSLTVPLTAGDHTVCIGVQNIGVGMSSVLKCVDVRSDSAAGEGVSTRYDTTRSASYNARYNTYSTTQLSSHIVTRFADATTKHAANHDPRGEVAATTLTGTSVQVSGWAVDPDFLDRRVLGAVLVDGVQDATFVTRAATPAQRKAGSGRLGAYRVSVSLPGGTHEVCVWLANVGLGHTATMPCSTVTVAQPSFSPAAATGSYPAATGANAVVVAEALRHLGQPYVWAAVGPNSFDCSGLVLYSYAKAGISVPRIAAEQAAAAHPITASDARPGDLVFYHDTTGHVFHVGIVLAPGRSVAAIDPAAGVDYQAITDPSATYGSFTHS